MQQGNDRYGRERFMPHDRFPEPGAADRNCGGEDCLDLTFIF
ncbi:MAG: hypothetical protein OJF48_004914 [Afipia sp.]|nr:MAG: hypothetical protein OJF48_004914 [Afipia sp.]